MSENAPDRPFVWSEIHSIAKERIAHLDAVLREEIGKPKAPVPKSGAERRHFFLLLEEKANSWGDRARDAYEDCLKQIGRADSPSARYSVFHNGLSFFLTDNLRHLLYLECGCYVERPYTVRIPNQPRTFTILEVPHDVGHLLNGICGRVKSRIREQFIPTTETWLEIVRNGVVGKPEEASLAETETKPPAFDVPERQPVNQSTGEPAPDSKGLLLKYRSEIKRAILIQLTQNPSASDHDICRGLDADGAVELPDGWTSARGNRLFTQAYIDPGIKPRIEKTISKVRADLRASGLLLRR